MGDLFYNVNWLATLVGFVAAFVAGWVYYSPRGFYPAWSRSAGVTHAPGDPMAVSFGSLIAGLILYSLFVSVMLAKGEKSALLLGIVAFIVMGYAGGAFKKQGAASRNIDAGSWALSGVLMLAAHYVL